MNWSVNKPMLPLVLVLCWIGSTGLVQASDPTIVDNAKLFNAETLKKANDQLIQLKKATNKTVVIETYNGVPVDRRTAFRSNRAQFYDRWAAERGKAINLQNGTLFLVCIEQPEDVASGSKPSKRIEVWTDAKTMSRFTKNEANQAVQKLGTKLNSDPNQGLLDLVASTRTSMMSMFGTPVGTGFDKPAGSGNALAKETEKGVIKQAKEFGNKTLEDAKEGRMDVMTIVLIIGGCVLGFWILIGLVRAFTRPRMNAGAYGTPPPPGGMVPPPPAGYGRGYGQPIGQPYGQPMGYPPQQAGGMGFMGSLMTGMLGAAAGSYMYDKFFRGGQHHDHGPTGADAGGGYYGGGSSTAEPQTGYTTGGDFGGEDSPQIASSGNDYDQGITGGDTNFGGSSAGADYDAGGDFGGGGGDFGGGDFGGGDFGGGDSGGGDF